MQVQGDAPSEPTPPSEPPDRFDLVVGRVERVAGAATKVAVAVVALTVAGALAVGVLSGEVTAKEAIEAWPVP